MAQETKRSHFYRNTFVFFILVLMVGGSVRALAAQGQENARGKPLDVSVTLSPPAEQVHPDRDLVSFHIDVTRNGHPLQEGTVHVTLEAPPKSTLLTTDFPVVEGTELLSLEAPVEDGTVEFSYLLPIRGQYTLKMQVVPSPSSSIREPVQFTRSFRVYEHPGEVRNAWMMVAGLFVLGLLSGGIVRKVATGASAAGGGATSMFVLLMVLLLPVQLLAHGPGEHEDEHKDPLPPAHVQKGDRELFLLPPSESPRVGKLTPIEVRKKQGDQEATEPTRFTVECLHEAGFPVFRMETHAESGTFQQNVQFFDGAPHEVRVTAEEIGSSENRNKMAVGRSLQVTAIQPPTPVVIRMMTILLGIYVLGMGGGFFGSRYLRRLGFLSSSRDGS